MFINLYVRFRVLHFLSSEYVGFWVLTLLIWKVLWFKIVLHIFYVFVYILMRSASHSSLLPFAESYNFNNCASNKLLICSVYNFQNVIRFDLTNCACTYGFTGIVVFYGKHHRFSWGKLISRASQLVGVLRRIVQQIALHIQYNKYLITHMYIFGFL